MQFCLAAAYFSTLGHQQPQLQDQNILSLDCKHHRHDCFPVNFHVVLKAERVMKASFQRFPKMGQVSPQNELVPATELHLHGRANQREMRERTERLYHAGDIVVVIRIHIHTLRFTTRIHSLSASLTKGCVAPALPQMTAPVYSKHDPSLLLMRIQWQMRGWPEKEEKKEERSPFHISSPQQAAEHATNPEWRPSVTNRFPLQSPQLPVK